MARELTSEELAWRCNEKWIPWKTSAEVDSAPNAIVGQDRAVEAIEFGLAMEGVGFNIFVAGLSGTGRLTTIKRFLDRQTNHEAAPDDVCFVYNFKAPEEPSGLFLKAGRGRRFRDAMTALVRSLAEDLPATFKDSEVRKRMEGALSGLQARERSLIEGLEKEVREAGFGLVQVQMGPITRPDIVPLVDGEPVSLEALDGIAEEGKLSAEDVSRIREVYGGLAEKLQEVFQQVGELREEMQSKVAEVRKEVVRPTLEAAVERVRRQVRDSRVEPYLKELRADLDENLERFAGGEEETQIDPFLRWRVNLVVDNADRKGRPVVMETEPSYTNVFGTIERSWTPKGETVTDFTRIRAGSLLRANGGYLVLDAESLLVEPRVWPALKRALKYSRAQIQSLETLVLGASLLKPEPVPLKVKVLVIGQRNIYDFLYRHDVDFPKTFKVLADFDSVMPASADTARDIISVLRKVCVEENLLALDQGGMAAILEVAVRYGHWRRRFSSRFSDLADAVREASFIAGREKAKAIGRAHVEGAVEAYGRRHGLSEDRTHDYLLEEVIRVETDGESVGQVNGLAVYDLGHHRFGKPSRITARVGLGREGVINVERQAGLSGPTHDKGVSILTGFLRGTFARRVPLTMGCSVTFEQSYGGIDGDSASSTEIYAILSALSEIPLRQDVAVTGSVDQYGRIQAIGGVNDKIEGFFRLCRDRGLTGNQGVLIPAPNVADVHLKSEVVEAVSAGDFHVWAVETVEEGIELLTGRPAGTLDEDDAWTEGSVYAECQEHLEEMARLLRQAGKDKAENEDDNGDEENGKEESADPEEKSLT